MPESQGGTQTRTTNPVTAAREGFADGARAGFQAGMGRRIVDAAQPRHMPLPAEQTPRPDAQPATHPGANVNQAPRGDQPPPTRQVDTHATSPVRTDQQSEPQPAPIDAQAPPRTDLTPVVLDKEFQVGIVSAHQRVEKDGQKNLQVVEQRSRELARLMMTEERAKWEGRFPKISSMLERFWKYSVGEVSTYSKEKSHAVKLLAAGGLQVTNIDADFFKAVDQVAKGRVAAQRKGFMGKMRGVGDLFNGLTFREGAVHNNRVAVMNELRQAVENPTQPVDAALQATLDQYKNVLTGDAQASEALARKVNTEFGTDLIHATVGEKMAEASITLDDYMKDAQGNVQLDAQGNPVKNKMTAFFKENVVQRLLVDGLAKGDGTLSADVVMQTRQDIKNFFISKDFIDWYDSQPADVQKNLDLSLSYGTDMIPVIEEVILPQVLQAKEHMQAAGNLDTYVSDMVLKVQVGTLESGQKGVLDEGIMERAATRSITNERVQNMYRNLRRNGTAPKLASDRDLQAGANWADVVVGTAGRVGTHQVLMGFGVGAGILAGQRALGMGSNMLLPVVGGSLASGALKGVQEWRLLNRERQQHGIESELGYEFTKDMRRRQDMEKTTYHMREMQTDLVDPMQQLLQELKTNNTLSDTQTMDLLGKIADTNARFGIMDREGIGLLAANNPQAYQVEKTNLELTKAMAMKELKGLLQREPQRLAAMQASLNIPTIPAGVDGVDYIVGKLATAQEKYIKEGTGQTPDYQAALGNVTIAQNDAMKSRDSAFNRHRAGRVGMAFVWGAAVPMGTYGLTYGAHEVFNTAADYVVNNNVMGIGAWAENAGLAMRNPDTFMGADLRGAFDKPGNYPLDNNLEMRMDPKSVGGDYKFTIFDKTTGQTIPTPPMWLHDNPNGHPSLIVAGKFDQMPSQLQGVFQQVPRHESAAHNIFAHTRALAMGGIGKIPDTVIGGENDYKGNFLINTHDISQSNTLNPDGKSYDAWAAAENRIDPVTGKVEIGKMSITGPGGVKIDGFTNSDGSYTMNLKHYGNADLAANPGKLKALVEGMKVEGWDVVQTGDTLRIEPPSATEYDLSQVHYEGGHGGIPFFMSRQPLERPEAVRGQTPPLIREEPEDEVPSTIPPVPPGGQPPVVPPPPPPAPDGEDDDVPEPPPAPPEDPEDEQLPEDVAVPESVDEDIDAPEAESEDEQADPKDVSAPSEEIPIELEEVASEQSTVGETKGDDASKQEAPIQTAKPQQGLSQSSYQQIQGLGVAIHEDMSPEDLISEIQKKHPDWTDDYAHQAVAREAIAHVRNEKTREQLGVVVDGLTGVSDQYKDYLKKTVSPQFLANINGVIEKKLLSRDDVGMIFENMFSSFSGKSDEQLVAAHPVDAKLQATLQPILVVLEAGGRDIAQIQQLQYGVSNAMREKPELQAILQIPDSQKQKEMMGVMMTVYLEELAVREKMNNA